MTWIYDDHGLEGTRRLVRGPLRAPWRRRLQLSGAEAGQLDLGGLLRVARLDRGNLEHEPVHLAVLVKRRALDHDRGGDIDHDPRPAGGR